MFWKDERLTSIPIGDNEFVIVNGKAIEKFWIPGEFRQFWCYIKQRSLSEFKLWFIWNAEVSDIN